MVYNQHGVNTACVIIIYNNYQYIFNYIYGSLELFKLYIYIYILRSIYKFNKILILRNWIDPCQIHWGKNSNIWMYCVLLTDDVHWITSRQLSPSCAVNRNHSPASLSLHISISKLSSFFGSLVDACWRLIRDNSESQDPAKKK